MIITHLPAHSYHASVSYHASTCHVFYSAHPIKAWLMPLTDYLSFTLHSSLIIPKTTLSPGSRCFHCCTIA